MRNAQRNRPKRRPICATLQKNPCLAVSSPAFEFIFTIAISPSLQLVHLILRSSLHVPHTAACFMPCFHSRSQLLPSSSALHPPPRSDVNSHSHSLRKQREQCTPPQPLPPPPNSLRPRSARDLTVGHHKISVQRPCSVRASVHIRANPCEVRAYLIMSVQRPCIIYQAYIFSV